MLIFKRGVKELKHVFGQPNLNTSWEIQGREAVGGIAGWWKLQKGISVQAAGELNKVEEQTH